MHPEHSRRPNLLPMAKIDPPLAPPFENQPKGPYGAAVFLEDGSDPCRPVVWLIVCCGNALFLCKREEFR